MKRNVRLFSMLLALICVVSMIPVMTVSAAPTEIPENATTVEIDGVTYTFDEPTRINGFRLIVDSDLDREYVDGNPDALNISTVLFKPLSYNRTTFGFPRCMVKQFRIEALDDQGQWNVVYEEKENYQRFIREKLDVTAKAIRFVPISTYASERMSNTYGSAQAHIFAFEVY